MTRASLVPECSNLLAWPENFLAAITVSVTPVSAQRADPLVADVKPDLMVCQDNTSHTGRLGADGTAFSAFRADWNLADDSFTVESVTARVTVLIPFCKCHSHPLGSHSQEPEQRSFFWKRLWLGRVDNLLR